MNIPNQLIEGFPNITLSIKREDLIHPFVSGNKFRKLKYNLLQANNEKKQQLLTFGGAFSNHIAAVAALGKLHQLKTVGVIRGDELVNSIQENPTLRFTQACGMELDFVSRAGYRNKTEASFLSGLEQKWGSFYLIPEGGTNALAVKGCEEILTETDAEFDFICCAVGTGGTISGLINRAQTHQKILGFPALKGDFLKEEICRFATNERWDLISDYHFDGYGKVTPELIDFINRFYLETGIPLDPIYTGKMVFGVIDLIQKNYFPEGSKILMIHTGGLQGIEGMNIQLKNKKLPLLLTHA
ncbi:pyridoxal-phosphate dependent enzyme [Flavobacterium sp.]|uniref:1-aminocyclopropane-1-carboxylate deaminase/D-cysteine desulfhydrase n=1 Tax=Flavobacterium sp. TaxID=239 RepID=UPI00286BD717|nr:pyridoxal-phosphate dependent enzyme [Flavobacterium sp.]